MKKIAAVFILLLSFAISAKAQVAKEKNSPKKATTNKVIPEQKVTQKAESVRNVTPEQKLPPEVIARTQVAELAKLVQLDSKQIGQYSRFFTMKNRTMSDPNLTPEKKSQLSQTTVKMLEGTLTQVQLKQLREKSELYNQLVN